jgi:hypothetical protein
MWGAEASRKAEATAARATTPVSSKGRVLQGLQREQSAAPRAAPPIVPPALAELAAPRRRLCSVKRVIAEERGPIRCAEP